jgi:hypothetical protein
MATGMSALFGLSTVFAAAAPANQPDASGAMAGCAAMMGTLALIVGVVFVFSVIVGWKIFTKAGQPGWASIVPVYSAYVLVIEICKMEILWFILLFVPIGNIIASFKICVALAEKFGKDATFGIGLFFLSPIFATILAFGSAEYQDGGSKKKYKPKFDDEEEEEEDEDEDDRPRKKGR